MEGMRVFSRSSQPKHANHLSKSINTHTNNRLLTPTNTPHMDILTSLYLEALSRSRNFKERAEAAKKTDSDEILERLAKDETCIVREAVAANWNAPAKVLVALAGDGTATVRAAAAANQKSGHAH
jgi:hypothetical protein